MINVISGNSNEYITIPTAEYNRLVQCETELNNLKRQIRLNGVFGF